LRIEVNHVDDRLEVGDSLSWLRYFEAVVHGGTPWLDQSNAAVHAQLISAGLEAARELQDTSCIDLGCGRGQLAGVLRALGAHSVTAVDFSPQLIEENTRRWPEIDWRCGDAGDAAMIARLPRADRVFVVELLQYVDARQVILSAWDRVGPGGRLVAVCPHAGCTIVRRIETRFEGRYQGLDVARLEELASHLPGLAAWAVRGLSFTETQQITPYRLSPWGHGVPAEANRINFVLIRS
jgi:2-polyprenyl-3-methyl-5-hydroxy-6-metoxy-1,4-benzoquinol methylase